MAKAPGTKNRSTLIAELETLGRKGDFASWSRDQLVAEIARMKTPPPETHILAPTTPKVIIDPDTAKRIVTETRKAFDDLIEHYAPGKVNTRGQPIEIPERIQDKLRKVFYAPTVQDAQKIAKAAEETLYIHLLAVWSNGAIAGPNTVSNISNRAKTAESLANFLEKEGSYEAAEKQRQRAEEIRSALQDT